MSAAVARHFLNLYWFVSTQYLFASFIYRDASHDLIMDCWQSKNPAAHAAFIASQEVVAEADADAAVQLDEEDNGEGDKTINTGAVLLEADKPATVQNAHPATDCSGNHFSEVVLDVRFPSEPEKIYKLLYQTSDFQEEVTSDMKLTGRVIPKYLAHK